MEMVIYLVYLAVVGAAIAGMWKVFVKAGEPGWASLVPIYNAMILGKISGKGEMTGLLACIPCVGIYFFYVINVEIAKKFGKEAGYAIGLTLLGFVFYPMLGFSDARFEGSRGGGRGRDRFDDDDDDDRGRGRRRDDDDDDDDRGRGRSRGRDRDDDDDDRPRRR